MKYGDGLNCRTTFNHSIQYRSEHLLSRRRKLKTATVKTKLTVDRGTDALDYTLGNIHSQSLILHKLS